MGRKSERSVRSGIVLAVGSFETVLEDVVWRAVVGSGVYIEDGCKEKSTR